MGEVQIYLNCYFEVYIFYNKFILMYIKYNFYFVIYLNSESFNLDDNNVHLSVVLLVIILNDLLKRCFNNYADFLI